MQYTAILSTLALFLVGSGATNFVAAGNVMIADPAADHARGAVDPAAAEAVDRLQQYGTQRTLETVQAFDKAGRTVLVANGTAAAVLERAPRRYRVQLVEGAHKGAILYVLPSYVRR